MFVMSLISDRNNKTAAVVGGLLCFLACCTATGRNLEPQRGYKHAKYLTTGGLILTFSPVFIYVVTGN